MRSCSCLALQCAQSSSHEGNLVLGTRASCSSREFCLCLAPCPQQKHTVSRLDSCVPEKVRWLQDLGLVYELLLTG